MKALNISNIPQMPISLSDKEVDTDSQPYDYSLRFEQLVNELSAVVVCEDSTRIYRTQQTSIYLNLSPTLSHLRPINERFEDRLQLNFH
jgi:hypothetical protein